MRMISGFQFFGVCLALSSNWVGCGATQPQGGASEAGSDESLTTDSSPTEAAKVAKKDAGSLSSNTDSSTPESVDAGARVPLKFGDCPTFTPCDGDPTGTWRVNGGCVANWDVQRAMTRCSTLAMVSGSFSAWGSGTVRMDGTTFVGNTRVSYTGKVRAGEACQKAAGDCAGYAKVLVDDYEFDPTTTCKSNSSNGCDCTISKTIEAVDNVAYTQTKSTIELASGGSFDFCSTGSELHQQVGTSHRFYFAKE